ncbi:hypothetical protein AVEN_160025-1 [Araneus ventricosus]|uniref:Uncharacterized protein n=1 Tax=Araneus ventricosus TaxID=182803 RepID=A0A4Y2NMJ6_ARAVE|nr:hypothetical protein AVEN_160025-1 [Araneus ventricosus]
MGNEVCNLMAITGPGTGSFNRSTSSHRRCGQHIPTPITIPPGEMRTRLILIHVLMVGEGIRNNFFAYQQLNSNFTCGDPTFLPYQLIHSRNRGTVAHNVRLPERGKSLMFTRHAS